MLQIENLSKCYGDHQIFEGLTYTFEPGCVALCEEDSTGKSSLLNIIAGVLMPDTGDVQVDGYSMIKTPAQANARIAHVPAHTLMFPTLTGRGLLEQVAVEKQVALDEDMLDLACRLGLEPHLDKRFDQMSTGTRRKVFLTAAALGEPSVIVADGPSDGLDAQAREALAEQFKRWAKDRVVLFASHDAALVLACGAVQVRVADLHD